MTDKGLKLIAGLAIGLGLWALASASASCKQAMEASAQPGGPGGTLHELHSGPCLHRGHRHLRVGRCPHYHVRVVKPLPRGVSRGGPRH
jgi:hypothetical protein